jgi:hypothetical protein
VVVGGANPILQNDTRRFHSNHPTARLLDNSVDASEHLCGLPTVLQHLAIEVETPIAVIFVERLADFFCRLDSNPITRLET